MVCILHKYIWVCNFMALTNQYQLKAAGKTLCRDKSVSEKHPRRIQQPHPPLPLHADSPQHDQG